MRITFFLLFLSVLVHAQNQDDIQLANEYLLKGDKKKALELYRDLAKSDANTSFIYRCTGQNFINDQKLASNRQKDDYCRRPI